MEEKMLSDNPTTYIADNNIVFGNTADFRGRQRFD